MPLCLTRRIERMSRAVTGRSSGLFAGDCAAHLTELRTAVAGRRVLVAGGAGSIGSATISELVELGPAALVVLDTSENNLAELIRHLRAASTAYAGELLIEPLDYGSPLAAGFLASQKPFDLVLSFAALKHVRSERDGWSLLRMLEVNLLKADRFLSACRRHGHGRAGTFLVSTDKAADPVSLMGASKRAMEALLWAHASPGVPASLVDGGEAPPLPRATTTRFANVLFSDGSLPWAFLQRLEKGQPLAAPGDIRRYLVSPREAGQLCLLAALLCPHSHLLVPRLDTRRDQFRFTDVATATLAEIGLQPAWYEDESQARASVDREHAAGRWPVMVTRSDTSGEKPEEIFVGLDERAVGCGLESVDAVAAGPVSVAAVANLLAMIDRGCRAGDPPGKPELVASLARVVPQLHHVETGRSLDGKL